ncbi:MAG: polysaccharide biosynthesis protein, partial [bacterium]
VERIFTAHRPQVVFHAAAYKHVPMLETQVREAVRNNVMGTRNVALAADKTAAEEFVLISTDKAVNPGNVMGATKRAAEVFCQNLNRHSETRFITVRFGNVLGSTGSVVPLFKEQIARGGPVTVTHRDVERFFMTTREACQLIMQASVLGGGGEIFVLDMGKPVKIDFLARQLILLSGKTPDEDIRIEYVGLRPGEKLMEELFHHQENLDTTAHRRILLARHREYDWRMLTEQLQQMEHEIAAGNADVLKSRLAHLIPEATLDGVVLAKMEQGGA